MAKPRIDFIQQQKDLFVRTEGYSIAVRGIYDTSLQAIIDLVKNTELEDGKPFTFANYGYDDKVTTILRSMYSQIYKEIRDDAEKEWMLSNDSNDRLMNSLFGGNAIEDNHFARYFNRNKEAMDAFMSRKISSDGLGLSQKIWDYVGQHKIELEDSIDLAIGEGTPANRLATKLKEYLLQPDRFYRRFRIKISEDANGNPVYGTIWKRKIFDKETGLYKWINEDPKKYKSGTGVYRSSYRNAQRLARTETNMAYRSADFERWQQLPFVVGVEIRLSNNHPKLDICDDLKGIYPKEFKWVGWHPHCRCYMTPVMATQGEMDKMIDDILSGDSGDIQSANSVDDYPAEFKTWITNNEDRIAAATEKGTLPYFIKDNAAGVKKIINPT